MDDLMSVFTDRSVRQEMDAPAYWTYGPDNPIYEGRGDIKGDVKGLAYFLRRQLQEQLTSTGAVPRIDRPGSFQGAPIKTPGPSQNLYGLPGRLWRESHLLPPPGAVHAHDGHRMAATADRSWRRAAPRPQFSPGWGGL
jgi:hypothetical protein